MKSTNPWLLVTFASAFLATLLACPCRAADPTYHFLREISVSGDEGWDWLSIDETARRLYVTHGSKIVVLDLDTENIIGEITDTPGAHGFAIATDLGLGFSSNGKESKASIVDLKTLKTLQS